MSRPHPPGSLSLLRYPYRALHPFEGSREVLRSEGSRPGSALVWSLGPSVSPERFTLVQGRPGGLPLIVILPDLQTIIRETRLVTLVTEARPQSILPHHDTPHARELAQALRRPPEDMPVEVTDYLAWRGIQVERDTRHILRKIVELSTELRSVSALARALYISRRALGRRFLSEGLPVPSHWLHFSRLLRVGIRLQNTEESVLSLGFDAGYPDGFSLSNQMYRLTGYRPTDVRRFLGWEWLMEAWLRREADTGGLAPSRPEDSSGAPTQQPAPPFRDRRIAARSRGRRRSADRRAAG